MCFLIQSPCLTIITTLYVPSTPAKLSVYTCDCASRTQSILSRLLPVEILAALQAQLKCHSQQEFSASPLYYTSPFTLFLPFNFVYFLLFLLDFKFLEDWNIIYFTLNPSWHITLCIVNVQASQKLLSTVMSCIPVIHSVSVSRLDTTVPFTLLVLKMVTRQSYLW